MHLGKIVLVTAGVAAGLFIGYAVKSEKVRPAAVSAVKAGIKAKDWTTGQYENIKGEAKSLVKQAEKAIKSADKKGGKAQSVEKTA